MSLVSLFLFPKYCIQKGLYDLVRVCLFVCWLVGLLVCSFVCFVLFPLSSRTTSYPRKKYITSDDIFPSYKLSAEAEAETYKGDQSELSGVVSREVHLNMIFVNRCQWFVWMNPAFIVD